MAEIKQKDKTLQVRYTEGDEYHQILLDRAKKDHLLTRRGFNLAEANRRTVFDYSHLEQENKELKAHCEWIEKDVLLLPSAKGKLPLKCACEGCPWFDGWNSKRNIPRCANPNPPIDKRFLSKTIGEICRKAQEERIQLEMVLGRKITRKNVSLAIAMAKKFNVMDAELSAVKNEKEHLQGELGKINRELSSNVTSTDTSMSQINTLKQNLSSKESKIQNLNQQISDSENEKRQLKNEINRLRFDLEGYRKYDLLISCPKLGKRIGLYTDCIPQTRQNENECWMTCESYTAFLNRKHL